MNRAANVILVTLLIVATPVVSRAQSSSWTPGHDGPQTDSGSSALDDALSPWLPATLAIAFHTTLAGCSVYCIAKRSCSSGSRFVLIALSYGIGTLDGLVGTLLLTRDVDDPALQHEDRVVGYTALGFAALNIGLGLWNHLMPQKTGAERRLELAPTVLRDTSGGSGPGLLLSRRF